MHRLILFLLTLGLGAVGYSLLRSGSAPAAREATSPGGGTEPEPAAAAPGRCAAITQGGSRCTREAEPGSGYCWQHGG